MKRSITLLMILAGMLFPLSAGAAQAPVTEIDSLQASFWPDFDQPSVLVLLTGELPAATALPAEVSIPIPANAELNAVAQVEDAGMVSVDYEQAGGEIAFVVTQPRFRVEYYAPYELNGSTRSYDFVWQSSSAVAEMVTEIQKPANANNLVVEPQAVDISTNQFDGLVYHRSGATSVPAGVPYRLNFSYSMSGNGLTVDPQGAVSEMAGTSTTLGEGSNNWLLIGGVLALTGLAVAGTWMIATRRGGSKSKRPPKPSPKATTKAKVSVYCHVCGTPAEAGDQFCRQCGTKLKQI